MRRSSRLRTWGVLGKYWVSFGYASEPVLISVLEHSVGGQREGNEQAPEPLRPFDACSFDPRARIDLLHLLHKQRADYLPANNRGSSRGPRSAEGPPFIPAKHRCFTATPLDRLDGGGDLGGTRDGPRRITGAVLVQFWRVRAACCFHVGSMAVLCRSLGPAGDRRLQYRVHTRLVLGDHSVLTSPRSHDLRIPPKVNCTLPRIERA